MEKPKEVPPCDPRSSFWFKRYVGIRFVPLVYSARLRKSPTLELFKPTENPKHASALYTPTVLVNFKCLNLKI